MKPFKSARFYQLDEPYINVSLIDQANREFELSRFIEPTSLEEQSAGFTPPVRQNEDLIVSLDDDHYLCCLRIDKKQVPASALKQKVDEQCLRIEQEQGFPPGRKQRREITDDIRTELLKDALCSSKRIYIVFSPDYLLFGAASEADFGAFWASLPETLPPLQAALVHTERSAAEVFTHWLSQDAIPAPFSSTGEAQMKCLNNSGATVQWVNDSRSLEKAREHYERGKRCVKLGLAWDDGLRFVVDDQLVLRKIHPMERFSEQLFELPEFDAFGLFCRSLLQCFNQIERAINN